MSRSIKLKRYAVDATSRLNNFGAYRLRIEVEEVVGPDIDKYLFVYCRGTPNAYTDETCDLFTSVAGPAQFSHYPAQAPDANHGWPFYRLDYVELDFISAIQAAQVWEQIHRETHTLLCAFDKLDQLTLVEDIWCPSDPDVSVSADTDHFAPGGFDSGCCP